MKTTKPVKILSAVTALLGLTAAVVPIAVYKLVETAGEGHTENAMAMKMACETACISAAVIGGIVTIVAVLSLFIKTARLGAASSAILIIGGGAAIAVPRVIGFCEMSSMACVYFTKPTLLVLGIFIIALSAIRLAQSVISLKKSAALS